MIARHLSAGSVAAFSAKCDGRGVIIHDYFIPIAFRDRSFLNVLQALVVSPVPFSYKKALKVTRVISVSRVAPAHACILSCD